MLTKIPSGTFDLGVYLNCSQYRFRITNGELQGKFGKSGWHGKDTYSQDPPMWPDVFRQWVEKRLSELAVKIDLPASYLRMKQAVAAIAQEVENGGDLAAISRIVDEALAEPEIAK